MTNERKTVRVSGPRGIPPGLSKVERVACRAGSSTYHVVEASKFVEPPNEWRALCGAGEGAGAASVLGDLARWHTFRFCRACIAKRVEP